MNHRREVLFQCLIVDEFPFALFAVRVRVCRERRPYGFLRLVDFVG